MRRLLVVLFLYCTALHGHGFKPGSSRLVGRAESVTLTASSGSSTNPTGNKFVEVAVSLVATIVTAAAAVVWGFLGGASPVPESSLDTNLAMAQLD